MKNLLILFCLLIGIQPTFAIDASEINVMQVNHPIRDFKLDNINLSTPLDFYLSRAWILMTGRERYWADISSVKFGFDPAAPDIDVDDVSREHILNEKISCIASYRDSVAVIVTEESPDFYLITSCWIENHRWVNGGQGWAEGKEELENSVMDRIENDYINLPRIATITNMPPCDTPFISHLKTVSDTPEQYLLDKLRAHRLVINGEYHNRKVSWDMLKRLIAQPDFADICGTVFMELPSWKQPTIDRFMNDDSMDIEKIYEIQREEQPLGWPDRGECEFLCELYRLNNSLPDTRRIRVILADYQIPYSLITGTTDNREKEDRNTHMADIIESHLSTLTDDRNSLFLVGCAHAYKSTVNGIASSPQDTPPAMTAGAQLASRLGNDNVFTVFQHVLPGDNSGQNKTLIRGGAFDRAFEANGNKPLGFDLANSPFGTEPFDGIYEIKWLTATGSYAENFDGYLFLHPIADEPKHQKLNEIYTPEFVDEIKHRATVLKWDRLIPRWFGCTIEQLTQAHFIE